MRSKVLIIEPDREYALTVKQFLEGFNYEVKLAPDGESGHEIAQLWLPDLVFCELELSSMSGFELLEKFKKNSSLSDIIFIVMTLEDSEEVFIIGLAKEAEEVLLKPLKMSEVTMRMEGHIKRKKRHEKLESQKANLKKEKELLMQFFSEDVVAKIISGEIDDMSGENSIATVMFLDVRNFTGISEYLNPKDVAKLLNMLFTDFMDLIFKNNGSVNKLIGDAILATFGVPMSHGKDALNAVKCAIEMVESINIFNMVKPDNLREDIRIGIGITTGSVFAGNIGSYRRKEYTVIGDVVNQASRIEAMTKKVDVPILIDRKTKELAGDDISEYIKKKIKHQLRGRQELTTLYGLNIEKFEIDRK